MSKKLFDFVIGNPPYQDNIENNNNSQPMYNIFMDATYDVANKVELITPARFLFNAGQTPKSWNEKMLHDEHFKVLKYESNGKNVFPSADIKGGVAITYHDFLSKYDAIVDFIEYPIVKDICNKVGSRKDFCSLNLIHHNRSSYRLSEIFSENHPEFGKMDDKGKITFDTSITSNIFEKLKNVLSDDEFENSCCIFGREENSRTKKWLEKKYIYPITKISISGKFFCQSQMELENLVKHSANLKFLDQIQLQRKLLLALELLNQKLKHVTLSNI